MLIEKEKSENKKESGLTETKWVFELLGTGTLRHVIGYFFGTDFRSLSWILTLEVERVLSESRMDSFVPQYGQKLKWLGKTW